MALNRELIGKAYAPQQYRITADESQKYAVGYNEDLPMFLDASYPGGVIAPPMFAVKYAGASIVNAFFDPEFHVDFTRLVHGEQAFEFYLPVGPGDTVTTVLKIAAVEEKSSGETFTTRAESTNQNGEKIVRMDSTFFIRGPKSGGSKPPASEEPAPKRYVFMQDMHVREDQTYIYAEGSGDHNPIHVDPEFAKKVGLPGIILQGLCTMAFCFKAVQDNYCAKDPIRIRRLTVRFAKPVLPLDTVTTRAWEEGGGGQETATLGFDAVNQRGDVVIKNGLVEVTK